MPELSPILAFLMAAATGILSGCGIGGGTLLIILLTLFCGASQDAARAVNLSYFLTAAGAALWYHRKSGLIDRAAFLPAMSAGVITAALAAWLAPRIDTGLLHRLFGGILCYVGIRELFTKAQRRTNSR